MGYDLAIALLLTQIHRRAREFNHIYIISLLAVYYSFFLATTLSSNFEYKEVKVEVVINDHGESITVSTPPVLIEQPKYKLNSSFLPLGGLFGLRNSLTDIPYMYQIQAFEAFRYFVNQINLNPSILPNTTAVYKFFDSFNDPNYSLSGAIRMKNDNITVFVGPRTKDEVLASGFFTSNYNQSMISPSCIADGPDFSTILFGRTVADGVYQALALVELLKYMNWTLAVPVTTSDQLSVTLTNSLYSTIASSITIDTNCAIILPTASSQQDLPRIYRDFLNTAKCISTSPASVVVLVMGFDYVAIMLRALSQFPENYRLVVISQTPSSQLVVDPLAISRDAFPLDFFKGHIVLASPQSSDYSGFVDYLYSLNPYNNNYSYFVDTWKASFRCQLSGDYPPCPSNIAERNIIPSCLCTGNESMDQFAVYPECKCVGDAVRLITESVYKIQVSCSSENSSMYSFCNEKYISGKDIFDVLLQLRIPTDIGILGLEPYSIGYAPSPVTPCVEYLQFGNDGNFHSIGNYNMSILTMNRDLFSFKNNTIPISAVTPQDITINSVTGAIMFTLATILVFICLVFCVLFYIKRNDPVIRKSSPLFCELTLLGIILIDVSLMVRCLPQSNTTCILVLWLSVLGIAMVIGNLFAKTYRIFKIFSNIRVRTTAIRDIDLLKFVGASMLLFVSWLLVMTFANGTLGLVVNYSENGPLYAYYYCETPGDVTVDYVFLGILDAFVAVAILSLAAIVYMTRNVDSAYNESVYLGATVYFYVIILIITIPLLATNPKTDGYAERNLVEIGIVIILVSVFTLVVLFGTKLYQSYNYSHTTDESTRNSNISLDSRIVSRARLFSSGMPIDKDIVELEPRSNLNDHYSKFLTRNIWKIQDDRPRRETARKRTFFSMIFSKWEPKNDNQATEQSSSVTKRDTIGHSNTRAETLKHRKQWDQLNESIDSIGLSSLDNLLEQIQDNNDQQN